MPSKSENNYDHDSYHFYKNWIRPSEGANAFKILPADDWNDQPLEQNSADTQFNVMEIMSGEQWPDILKKLLLLG